MATNIPFSATIDRRVWPQPLIVVRDRLNPKEIWTRDPDGYLVVVAGPSECHAR